MQLLWHWLPALLMAAVLSAYGFFLRSRIRRSRREALRSTAGTLLCRSGMASAKDGA
jgi:hypothetical protein